MCKLAVHCLEEHPLQKSTEIDDDRRGRSARWNLDDDGLERNFHDGRCRRSARRNFNNDSRWYCSRHFDSYCPQHSTTSRRNGMGRCASWRLTSWRSIRQSTRKIDDDSHPLMKRPSQTVLRTLQRISRFLALIWHA